MRCMGNAANIETFVSSEIDLTVESVSGSPHRMRIRRRCNQNISVGDATEYRKVTESCYCPVVILGGEKLMTNCWC